MLIEGTDYLLFRSAFHSGGPITGVKSAEVAVIATRRFLFLVPVQETWLGVGWVIVNRHSVHADERLGVGEALARYLADPALTVERLERELLQQLEGEPEYLVRLDELSSLTVWSRFLRQVRYRRGKKATQVLALRGKANHERFRTFYADRLERRAAS